MAVDSSWLTKRRSAALITVVIGAFGTIWSGAAGWAVGRALDYLFNNLTWAAFLALSWTAIISGCALIVGLALLLWPEAGKKPLHRVLHIQVDRALARYNSTQPTEWRDVNRLGDSVAVSLKKAGFTVPPENSDWAVRAVMLQSYFTEIANLLNDGHMKEAKVVAASTVKRLINEFSEKHP